MQDGLRLLASLALAACSGAPPAPSGPPTHPAADAPPEPETPARPRDEEWGRVRLAELSLELALPEANAWQAGTGSAWFPLVHEPSESELELRLVRAERLVQPPECERRLRLERPDLPASADETTVDRRRVTAPEGFVTELAVSVEAVAADPAVVGHALGFGATVGKCFGVHFVTRARGSGAETEVARRLGLFVERVLPTLRVLGVEDRVEPAPTR